MVHHSARRASLHRDAGSVRAGLLAGGAQRASGSRALPMHVRRTRRSALRRASSAAEGSNGDARSAAPPLSLSGEPSQGAVGAPLTKAIREAQPAAGQARAGPQQGSQRKQRKQGSSGPLPATTVGLVAVGLGVGAAVGLKKVPNFLPCRYCLQVLVL